MDPGWQDPACPRYCVRQGMDTVALPVPLDGYKSEADGYVCALTTHTVPRGLLAWAASLVETLTASTHASMKILSIQPTQSSPTSSPPLSSSNSKSGIYFGVPLVDVLLIALGVIASLLFK